MMIGRQTAKERVASFLLLLHARKGVRANEVLNLPVGRKDVADYLGLTVETVSRILAELKRAGLIKFLRTNRQIVIRNVGVLRAVAEGNENELELNDQKPRSTLDDNRHLIKGADECP